MPTPTSTAIDRTPPSVSDIMDYEDGTMHEEDVLVLFQRLIDSGMLWHLQGSYQRTAERLIREGLIDPR